MAAESVGQIGLDLVVNRKQFDKQMAGIQGIAKKAGLALAAAFSVKKLVDFSAQCIKLGSDLQEVQNVVDVAFPHMSKQVDDFAKNAISSFGLSETMAKRFTGTFGAIAKAFGFNEQAAYEMSTTLTGLAGDVASFYNISQDEAYTKLKSVFTGETESLKDLGVVMTQAALDQYALANGYGRTTQAMSEAEKVALRYKFVQEQLSAASGDFIRTSDGWANQVRVLKLQFDSLKATIGQGLINVLTPVIKVINSIIGKLMSLANAFRAFTELITGKKSSGGGASAAAAGMEAVAGAADHAGAAMGKAAGGASKAAGAAKKVKQLGLASFDELNVLSGQNDSGGSGGGGGGAGGGYQVDDFDMGELDASADTLDSRYKALLERFTQLKKLFAAGFKVGLGDLSVFDSIQKHLDGIKQSLQNIFTDSVVQKAAKRFANIFTVSFGNIAGSVASIGATIADFLLGGIDQYLSENSQRIKDYLVSMFDVGGDIASILGQFSVAFADIFSVFRSEDAKSIAADILKVFSDAFMGVTELVGKIGRDILALLLEPFTNNKESLKEALGGFISAAVPVFDSFASAFELAVDSIIQVYDEHFAPVFDSITEDVSGLVGTFTESFNQYILPVLQNVGEGFSEVVEKYVKPAIETFSGLIGDIGDLIGSVWDNILKPAISWVAENLLPMIAPALEGFGRAFNDTFAAISILINSFLEILRGVIQFLTQAFAGDWSGAWTSLKDAFSRAFSPLTDLVKGIVRSVISALENLINGAIDGVNKFIGKINAIGDKVPVFDVPDIPTINKVNLPGLAQGGFVEANTPRLAIIGDNRNYGEIVAPEDKMQALLNKAVELGARYAASGSPLSIDDLYQAFKRALSETDLVAVMDSDRMFRTLQRKAEEYRKRTGKPAFVV